MQSSVLQALFESMSVLLRNVIDKRTLLENFDYLLLCIDEIVDNGYTARLLLCYHFVVLLCFRATPVLRRPCLTTCRAILETDPSIVASRVSLRGADTDMPLSEQVSSLCHSHATHIKHADLPQPFSLSPIAISE